MVFDFCKWVLYQLWNLGFQEVSVSTCLHHLGFEVITPCRGIYYDGHECEDYRKQFRCRMGFIHFTNAPTESACLGIPTDIDPPILEKR